jgi:hypothetical protein
MTRNKAGRPVMGDEPRTAQACIRITPTEKQALRDLCEREGLTEREVLMRGMAAQQRLFYSDPAGLLHEIRTENGAVSAQSMNQAVREYRDKYGTGIPVAALVHAEVKILNNEVSDDAN